MNTPTRVILRALTNVRPSGDCIISCYSTSTHGYAQIGWHQNGKTQMRLVHRVAWEAVNGAIPDDMTVDHLCRTRTCLRIDHLRLLTNIDNSRRNGPGRDFPLGWLCRQNHPASAAKRVTRQNAEGITCRTCDAESKQKSQKLLRQRKAHA